MLLSSSPFPPSSSNRQQKYTSAKKPISCDNRGTAFSSQSHLNYTLFTAKADATMNPLLEGILDPLQKQPYLPAALCFIGGVLLVTVSTVLYTIDI